MAKGSKRQRKSSRPPQKPHSRDRPFQEEDIDDEIDAFHKQRGMIPLDVNADAGDSDDDMEQPVFDIKGVDDDDSDNSGSYNEDDEDDDINGDKEIAKMTRQAKYLRHKNVVGDDEMSDDAEPEEENKILWGRRASTYYNAENADYELQSSDEEAPMEEEAEVVKIQREKANALSMEDFGLEDADQDESDSDGLEKTFQGILTGNKTMKKSDVDGVLEGNPFENYEEIKKDLNALSKEEQMDVVYSSAPELVGLLSELNEVLDQLQKAKPPKVREIKDIPKGGMHYLEVKHVLLLTYCQAIGFYLLLKSEGHPVRDHPVIARLVEIKNLFEKMKQIDVNLPSQFEELVNHIPISYSRNQLDRENVPLELKPDTTKVNEAVQLANDVSKNYDIKVDSKVVSKKHQDVQLGIQSVEMLKDVQLGIQSVEMLKVRANLEAKLKQKGIYNLTNPKPATTQNQSSTLVNGRLETLHDFDDEVRQPALCRGLNDEVRQLSQMVAAKSNKAKFVSGDDDLPKRDDIGERRRKFELRVLAGAGAGSVDDDGMGDRYGLGNKSMDIDVHEDDVALGSEDEFYKKVKKERAVKLKAKAELYSRTPVVPPSSEVEADGKRLISYSMEKNRGLTRSRKKLTKTPRKKYRLKHQNAVMRRKGQVREIRKPSGSYGGERTGINTSISHSVRFKS